MGHSVQEYLVEIFLDSSYPKNLGSTLFNYYSFAANCRSLTLLVLHILRLTTLLYFAREFLRKKYFRSPFLISCRCVIVVIWKVTTIKSYSSSASLCSKVLRKTIFLTLDEVLVPTIALSKLIRSCRISSGEPDSKLPTLNKYFSEVVLIWLRRSLILMRFLSLISTSFLIIRIDDGSFIA